MNQRVALMNLASEYIPYGAKIVNVDDDPSKIGMRTNDDQLVVIIEYTFKGKPYTMVLENQEYEWKIVDIYDNIGECIAPKDISINSRDKKRSRREVGSIPIKINGGFLWDEAIGDITGNKKIDKVYLTAVNTKDQTEFADDIKVFIEDGITKKQTPINLPPLSGFRPRVKLYDITGDGIKDIFISMFATGSGEDSYYYIYSFKNGVLKSLFNYEDYNKKNKFKVNYEDGYKVKIVSELARKEYYLDISDKCPSYLNKIYDSKGKLKGNVIGTVSPLNAMFPLDITNNDIYILDSFNRIIGVNTLDILGEIETYLGWDGKEIATERQYVLNKGIDLDNPIQCEE